MMLKMTYILSYQDYRHNIYFILLKKYAQKNKNIMQQILSEFKDFAL